MQTMQNYTHANVHKSITHTCKSPCISFDVTRKHKCSMISLELKENLQNVLYMIITSECTRTEARANDFRQVEYRITRTGISDITGDIRILFKS